jgi:hypothetical protein
MEKLFLLSPLEIYNESYQENDLLLQACCNQLFYIPEALTMALNTKLTTFPLNAALQIQFGQSNESLKQNILCKVIVL